MENLNLNLTELNELLEEYQSIIILLISESITEQQKELFNGAYLSAKCFVKYVEHQLEKKKRDNNEK